LCLCCLHVLWEPCFGKAADRVRLVSEDAGPPARVVVHDCVGVVGGGREDADAGKVGVVGDRHHDRQQAGLGECHVSPAVFPHDPVTAGRTNASAACSSIAV